MISTAALARSLPARIIRSFVDDDCPFLAGAVAYQIFFALIPLLALLAGGVAFLYGDEASSRRVLDVIGQVYPAATAEEAKIVDELVQGRALSLGLGAIGTLIGATAVYGSLGSALSTVLGRDPRGFFGNWAAAFGFTGALALVAAVSFTVSYVAAAAQDLLRSVGLGDAAVAAIGILGPLLGLAAGYVFFLLVYRLVPRRPVPYADARIAALVSAVLWEAAKLAFGVYTRLVGGFTVYGPLALAAGLLTWVYLTAMIILMGAEVAKVRGAARAHA